MTNLTTHQIELLRLAAGADVGAPDDPKTVRALIKRGLLIALPQAEGPSRLIITESGRAAVAAPESAAETEKERDALQGGVTAVAPKGKLGVLVTLLRGSDGATIAAMAAATGWQNHSVRGAMSGALKKKKLGYAIAYEQTADGRVYRIVECAAA